MGQLKVIVKADSQGVVQAVVSEINKIRTEQAFAKVVHSGVGEVTESDIMLASAGGCVVIGFDVATVGRVQKQADREGVEILEYDVIYHLTEKIQEIVEGRMSEEDEEKVIGELKVKGVFATTKKMAVIGGEVLSGLVRIRSYFRVFRESVTDDGEKGEVLVGEAQIESIQQGQKVANEVNAGAECGMRVNHKELEFQIGDRLELYQRK